MFQEALPILSLRATMACALGFYRDLGGCIVTWCSRPRAKRERMAEPREPDGNRVVILSRL